MLRVNQLNGFGARQVGGIGGNDTFTKLLLHLDGSDASTTITDSSSEGHSFSASGNAQIDTAQSKFGGASLLLDGSGDYINLGSTPTSLQPGTGDFAIDYWIRINSIGSLNVIAEWGSYLNGFMIRFNSSTMSMFINNSAKTFSWSPSTSTWYHHAFSRDGSNLRFFVDGTQVGSTASSSENITLGGSSNCRIGSPTHTSGQDVNGWIDEFRFSKGDSRWTSNFTPPSAPYS